MIEAIKDNIFQERLCVYLMILKITPNLKGYYYLKECATRVYHDANKKYNLNQNLYLDLSSMFNEKPSLIERALRHAIEVSWKKHGIDDFERMTKCEFYKEKPSPRELICVLVERASLDCKKMLNNKTELLDQWRENFLD